MRQHARRRFAIILFLVGVIIFDTGGSHALAQQAITSATLSGLVEDTAGASIGGALITVTNLDRNQTWKATADEQGRFRFLYLPVGAYRLRVESEGFTAFNKELTLAIGQALDIAVKLAVAGVAENVSIVAGEKAVIESSRTQLAESVAPQEINQLPLNGRNYLDLALLAPAVSRTNTGNNERFAETSAVPGTGISVAGQRNLNNGFIVDGLSANDDAADLAGTFFSQEVIREFQVVTSGGIAEFGRASSGVVNIITQSGTNAWRGRFYGFARNQRFDARNAFASSKDPLTEAQYGAGIGGPLVRARTFLFANFEQTRLNRAGFVTISPASVAAINDTLNRFSYNGPRAQTGEYSTGYHSTNYFARVDHSINQSNLLTARYSLYDITSANARNVGGLNDVSRGTGLTDRDQTFALSDTATLSAKAINEARFQFTRSRLAAPVNDALGPAINIAGVANLGTATFSPTARAIDLLEAVDNLSFETSEHTTKFGADFLFNRINIIFPGALQGVYTFSSLDSFKAGRYVTFQQAFGEAEQRQLNPNLGLFIQDEWKPRAGLTLNAGLRYDLQWLPDPIRTDATNFAPRIGMAFAPADHKTVVRASFGLYFDRVPLRAVSNALQRDGVKYRVAVLAAGQTGAPVFPNVLATFPEGLLTSITTIDPLIQNSYSEQVSLQIERELNRAASLSIGYQHLRGLHLIISRNINVPRFPASAGVPNLGRPDSRFANVNRFESAADSYYDAMTVSFRSHASRWASLRVSYTLSKAIDNAGNFFFSTPQNNFNIRDDRGLSANDQRHRLTVSGSLEVPTASSESHLRRALAGFQLSYIFTYGSGQPFNVQTGTDRNFDTNVNDRPVGVGRNTGRGFDFASLDLRLSRRVRVADHFAIEALAEGFNVLNRTNLQFPNNIFGPGTKPLASFGRATAAADARQLQFGLRLSF